MVQIEEKIREYGYISFNAKNEDWSEYQIEDGAIVKTKTILLKIIKEKDGYSFNETNVAISFSPSHLRSSPNIKDLKGEDLKNRIKNPNLKFDIVKENWNEYELDDGSILSTRTILTLVSQTDIYDQHGEPIYLIQSQTLHKVVPKVTPSV